LIESKVLLVPLIETTQKWHLPPTTATSTLIKPGNNFLRTVGSGHEIAAPQVMLRLKAGRGFPRCVVLRHSRFCPQVRGLQSTPSHMHRMVWRILGHNPGGEPVWGLTSNERLAGQSIAACERGLRAERLDVRNNS
jgi:hypothetical protein